jgi:hypothetical protein
MRRREEKNHHKFGGRSLSVYILRYLFCIHIGLLLHIGEESIAKKKLSIVQSKKKKEEKKWRRHRSSSTDGQVAPARNTIRHMYVCIHVYVQKKN